MNEEKRAFYIKQKEEQIKVLAEEFLKSINVSEEKPLTEDLLRRRDFILKDIVVKRGYIHSDEVKAYLRENYIK